MSLQQQQYISRTMMNSKTMNGTDDVDEQKQLTLTNGDDKLRNEIFFILTQ